MKHFCNRYIQIIRVFLTVWMVIVFVCGSRYAQECCCDKKMGAHPSSICRQPEQSIEAAGCQEAPFKFSGKKSNRLVCNEKMPGVLGENEVCCQAKGLETSPHSHFLFQQTSQNSYLLISNLHTDTHENHRQSPTVLNSPLSQLPSVPIYLLVQAFIC